MPATAVARTMTGPAPSLTVPPGSHNVGLFISSHPFTISASTLSTLFQTSSPITGVRNYAMPLHVISNLMTHWPPFSIVSNETKTTN